MRWIITRRNVPGADVRRVTFYWNNAVEVQKSIVRLYVAPGW